MMTARSISLVLVVAAGCTGASTTALDAGVDGGQIDAGPADAGPQPLTCISTVSSFCLGSGPCVQTWADVSALPCQQYCIGTQTGSCGGYNFISCVQADQGARAYFDADSGALVAELVDVGPTLQTACNTPSGTFMDPECDGFGQLHSCTDGG
ncbi:MAG: hypothetical protein JST54_05980 [Deltaproteobacteria bacterium]|nr:hypothetical protein [Deltaproteobacteria bacterium]